MVVPPPATGAELSLAGVSWVVVVPPPTAGAELSLVGVVEVFVYGESTPAGFFIDTIASPFDVFTVFVLLFTANKKSTPGVLSTSYEFWSHSIFVCDCVYLYVGILR